MYQRYTKNIQVFLCNAYKVYKINTKRPAPGPAQARGRDVPGRPVREARADRVTESSSMSAVVHHVVFI